MTRLPATSHRALALGAVAALALTGCATDDASDDAPTPSATQIVTEPASPSPTDQASASPTAAAAEPTEDYDDYRADGGAAPAAGAAALSAVDAAGMRAVGDTFPVDANRLLNAPQGGRFGGGDQECRVAVEQLRSAQAGDAITEATGRQYRGGDGQEWRRALAVHVTTDSPRDLGQLFGDVAEACEGDDGGRRGNPHREFTVVQTEQGGGFVLQQSPAEQSADGYFAAPTADGELVMLVGGMGAADAQALFDAQLAELMQD